MCRDNATDGSLKMAFVESDVNQLEIFGVLVDIIINHYKLTILQHEIKKKVMQIIA